MSLHDPADRRRIVGEVIEAIAAGCAGRARPRAQGATRLERAGWRSARGGPRTRRRPVRREPRPSDGAGGARGRQDLADGAWAKCARPSTSCAIMQARRASTSQARSRCPVPRARTMRSACTAAVSSPVSRPWNFPLAIFTGQIAGALAAGNAVLAKPAEQTPLIAAAGTRLLHQAGVPADALHLLPGDGPKLGSAALCGCAARRCRLHRLDRSGHGHQPRAGRQARADRDADRRDRRHERDDRGFHGAARTGDARRHRLGLRQRRPALFGACACCSCRTTSPTRCWS